MQDGIHYPTDVNNSYRCPDCSQALLWKERVLECSCGKSYPVVREIPHFVNDDSYLKNFGFEWNKHKKTQLDSYTKTTQSKDKFHSVTGWTEEELTGKTIMEAGCGAGRFLEVLAKLNADIYGVDISSAVFASRENLKEHPNVHVARADLFHLPFAKESFDFIFSIGVLHHAPNPKAAFLSLVPYLKNGGKIAVHVYSKANPITAPFYKVWRPFTTRMPHWLLYALSHIAAPKYYFDKTLFITRLFPPTSMHPDWRWRVLDTFDWYSPKYEFHYDFPEVFSWFEEAKLTNIRTSNHPTSVSGQKSS